MIRVFIIEDHYMVVEGIRSLLQQEHDIELIGSASTAASGSSFLKTHKPDVLLLDINLPDGNGSDLCKRFRELYPSMAIVVLTTFSQGSYVRQMMDMGASGYLLKNASQTELVTAIRDTARGKTYMSFEAGKALQGEKQREGNKLVIGRRELEVLQLIVQGFINQEIAEQLKISVNTVDTYRKSLLQKMDARNTADLVRIAIEKRIVTL
ncbi:MAG: response regulator transcription factor [Bacteroidota bacterium]|nr:response regulator transcription factor [Bacteroidota bacterium]